MGNRGNLRSMRNVQSHILAVVNSYSLPRVRKALRVHCVCFRSVAARRPFWETEQGLVLTGAHRTHGIAVVAEIAVVHVLVARAEVEEPRIARVFQVKRTRPVDAILAREAEI